VSLPSPCTTLCNVLQGDGPLAEIDFWRERNAALSALNEQLKLPTVAKMLDILAQKPDMSAISNFKMSRDELAKYYTEAKDNVRFLTTLERHFKVQCFHFSQVIVTLNHLSSAVSDFDSVISFFVLKNVDIRKN